MTIHEETVTINELIERIVVDFDYMIPSVFDVSDRGFEIEGFDFETKEKTYSKILKILIKPMVTTHYRIGTLNATAGHKLYYDGAFIPAEQHPDAELIAEEMLVVDFEIDRTHNYYANDHLNHNSTSGGHALKHACSVMINVNPMGGADNIVLDDNDQKIGHKAKAKVAKNKVGPPYRESIYTIKYTEGLIERETELLELAVLCGVIERPSTVSYLINGEKIVGKEKASVFLKNKAAFSEVEEACRTIYLAGAVAGSFTPSEDEEQEENDLISEIE